MSDLTKSASSAPEQDARWYANKRLDDSFSNIMAARPETPGWVRWSIDELTVEQFHRELQRAYLVGWEAAKNAQ